MYGRDFFHQGGTKMSSEKDVSQGSSNKKVKRSISTVLLSILLPVTVLGIAFIIMFLTFQAKDIIVKQAKEDLTNETRANANTFGLQVMDIIGKAEEATTVLETMTFDDNKEIQNLLEHTMHYSEKASGGMYIGWEDDDYIFADGHRQDDIGWLPTERGWFKEGKNYTVMTTTAPYVDATTNNLCVTFCRKCDTKDGRKGVVGIDLYLDGLAKVNAELKPLGTGNSAVISGDMIISHTDTTLDGKKISETSNDYLKSVKSYVDSGNSEVAVLKNNSGSNNYVAYCKIPGTDWILISSVREASILADLNSFQFVCMLIMIVMTVLIGAIILISINKIVKKPVQELSRNIVKISGGDFTVKLPKGNGDEIGLIRDEMRDYIEIMSNTIDDIQSTAGHLLGEARASSDASKVMSDETKEQSSNMSQIREAMDGMTSAVTELANNATELAGAVSDLTDKGKVTNDIMSNLIDSAVSGKKDMSEVKNNMTGIVESMTDMNDVVIEVGDSAQKITGIISMINSIAQQTNLLSLNASIEAARAGEAGKGFAVVAGEIAKLASDSGEATKEIDAIITDITAQINSLSDKSQKNMDSISQSSEAVTVAEKTFDTIYSELTNTGNTMNEMIKMMSNVDGIASSVAAISQQQSASSEEISATVESLVDSANRIAENSAAVDSSAGTVSQSAETISEALSIFKI